MTRICLVLGVVVIAGSLAGIAEDQSSPFGFVPATGEFLPCYVDEQLHDPEGMQIYIWMPGYLRLSAGEVQIPRAGKYWEYHGMDIPEQCLHFDDMGAASISTFLQTYYQVDLVIDGRSIPASYLTVIRIIKTDEDDTVYWRVRVAYEFASGVIAPGVYIVSLSHTWTLPEMLCEPSPWVPESIGAATRSNTSTVTLLYEPEGT